MILKSFEIENNIKAILKYKFVLIYGENIGLKEKLKKDIIKLNNKSEIINLYQEDISRNNDVIVNEVKNISLFAEDKTIVVNQISERVFNSINSLLKNQENFRIILIGELLDKKSKLRSLFEKESSLATIPCYNDNEITLRKIIESELKVYKNLNSNIVNMIINFLS